MKTVLRFFMTTIAGVAAFASFALADNHGGSMHTVSGHVRTRFVLQDNAALTDTNYIEAFYNRARLNFDVTPTDTLKVRITPETIWTWGSLDTARPNVAMYETWMAWMPTDMMSLYVGRQALSYGSGRVIGTEDWDMTGVSPTFDAARMVVSYDLCKTDFFWAKQNERNAAPSAVTDNNLFGLYNAFNMSDKVEFMNALDLYALYAWDSDVGGVAGVATKFFFLGARATGDIQMLDYEIELTTQFGEVAGTDSQKGLSADLTVGADVMEKHHFAVNVAYANSEYVNVYGDTHQFLGNADVIARNNLYALGLMADFGLTDEFSAGIDGYYFMRANTDVGHTGLNGAATAGTDRPLGLELDLSLAYQPEEMLVFDFGYDMFKPQGGFDTAGANKVFHDVYLQGTLSF